MADPIKKFHSCYEISNSTKLCDAKNNVRTGRKSRLIDDTAWLGNEYE